MIDAKEVEKELDYLDNFEFKKPIELSFQPSEIKITFSPGMTCDEIFEEFRQKIFEASREGISIMLRQCDDEIRKNRKRGTFHNVHTPEPKKLALWCGDVDYQRCAYYDQEGNYRHLCDEVLGLDKWQRVSISLLLRALGLAGEVSYERVAAQIEKWTGVRRTHETYRRWVLRIGEFMLEEEKRKCRAIFENPAYQRDDYGTDPAFLFLEADGCHIYMRLPKPLLTELEIEAILNGKKKRKTRISKKEVRLGLWFEGKCPRRGTEGNGQFEVTGKTYFGGLMETDDFWETAAMLGLERYGLGPMTQVFGSGDGAIWIGPHFEDFQKAIFSLCRFHWKREIFRAFSHDKVNRTEKGKRLIAIVESNDKSQACSFIDEEHNACEKRGSKEKLMELKNYLLNQWDYIQNYCELKRILEKIDPALARVGVIEGHIYQVLYLRFESRGGCWVEKGLNALFRVLTANLNGVLDSTLRRSGWEAKANITVTLEKEKSPKKRTNKDLKCKQGVFPVLQRPVSPLAETLKQIAHPEYKSKSAA